MAEGQLQLYAPDATEASIRACYASALASGKPSIIQLPDARITLTSPLPISSGISYEGYRPAISYESLLVPDYGWDFVSGTVLMGDGTFAAIEANAVNQGSVPSDLTATAITAAHLKDIGFDNFTRAVSVGAVNILGFQYSTVKDLYIRRCSDWGVHLANFMHSDIQRIFTCLCQNGQRYTALLPGASLMPGNSLLHTLFNVTPHDGRDRRLCRGIVFDAGGVNARLNELLVSRLQNNGFSRGGQLSVSAAFTSGLSAIGVPDGTKFVIGMPVQFTSTNYGVTLTQTYVVQSVSGNSITIGNGKTTAVITASGTGSLTLTSYGMANIELSSLNSGAFVSNSHFQGVDSEGESGAAIYFENATGIIMGVSEVPSTDPRIVGRNLGYSFVTSPNAVSTDFDATSTTSEFNGARSSLVQRALRGIVRSSIRSANGLNINSGLLTEAADIEARGNNLLYPNSPVAERVEARNTSQSPNAANSGIKPFNGAASQTMTLPTIVTDTSPAAATIGARFDYPNTGSNALAVVTDGTQLFNQIASKTSLSVAAGHMLTCIACKDAGGVLFWLAYDTLLSA